MATLRFWPCHPTCLSAKIREIMRKLKIEQVLPLIKLAIEEDLGSGDITSELVVKEDVIDKADIITREEIFVAGMDVASGNS